MRSTLLSPVFALAVTVSFVRSQILPSVYKPTAYHLKIDASDLATSNTFDGAVIVNFTLTNAVSSLMLHSVNLTLNESSLAIMKKPMFTFKWNKQTVSNISVNEEFFIIFFPQPIANGDYSLSVEYRGFYQERMTGFAKVGYHFKEDKKYLGVTALEPTGARRVFPCFDMPGYKTNFRLEITVSKTQVVVTNVRYTSVGNVSDTTRVFIFDKYPAMPVYQLGWAVLDQASYTLRVDNSTSTIIHTRAPFRYYNQTAWPNNLTARLVQAVENYTEVPLQGVNVTKIEQIVLPELFFGISEGYGFTSYSEEAILVAPERSSARFIQDVALGLTKGVVQQWFGDLVSIDSWDNMWMMKGLDQYLQYIIAASLPQMSKWELQDQALVELTQPALALDVSGSHPLTINTKNDPATVATVYDNLTKYKGGAIIRMLQSILGNSFDSAMASFIRFSFSDPRFNPSNPGSLWTIMYSIASDNNIDLAQQTFSTIMEQWTNASGYPILNVTTNTTHFNISQPSTSVWWVPVSYSLQGSSYVNRTWLPPGGFFTVKATSSKWILVNVNQTGFYRVNYTTALWQELSSQLTMNLTQLPRLSRAQLIDDIFSLNPLMAVNFTGFLRAETDYYPWNTALRHYQTLIFSMYGHSSYSMLQEYVLDLMNRVISDTGSATKDQDTHIDKLKRSLILEKACEFGHKPCIDKAVSILSTWNASTPFDPDLNPALLCAGVANSSRTVWYSVWHMYQNSKWTQFPSIRTTLLRALPCTYEKDLLYQFLNNITNTSNPVLSSKDKNIVLQTLASKPFGAQVLLKWLVERLTVEIQSSSHEESTATSQSITNTSSVTSPSLNKTQSNNNGTTDQNSAKAAAVPTTTLTANLSTNQAILTESDVITILAMVLPRITTMEDGTLLDSITKNASETHYFSNATLEVMNRTTRQIYTQADQVMKLDATLTVWLETSATSYSQPPQGSTSPSTQTNAPQSTAAPSRSSYLHSNIMVSVLALCLYDCLRVTV